MDTIIQFKNKEKVLVEIYREGLYLDYFSNAKFSDEELNEYKEIDLEEFKELLRIHNWGVPPSSTPPPMSSL